MFAQVTDWYLVGLVVLEAVVEAGIAVQVVAVVVQ